MNKKPAMRKTQMRAFDYGMEHFYAILAMAPRMGKSRVAIEIRETLRNNCLIVCPSHLILNWVKEIQKWAGPKVQITTFTKGSQIYDVCDADFVITSFDLVQKAPHLFEWADMVVIDEAHNIKSMAAKRTEFIHKHIYENSISRVLLLTGTPIQNRVKEFYSLLSLCYYNPREAEVKFLDIYPSEIDFADRFSYREEYTMEINNRWVTIMKWSGLQNQKELKSWLKGKYIRIRAEEENMPPVSYKPVYVSDTPNPQLLSAFNSFFMEDGNSSVKPDIKAEAALQKVPFTVKYVKDLLEEVDCCLVYTDHRASAHAIAKEFDVEAITGEMSGTKRSLLADKFQAGEGKVLVATVGALKEGKDLFRASDIVFNDFNWVPGNMRQVIDRMRTIGKTKLCTAHEIIGSPQDEYIIDTLKEKMDTIEQAT